VPCPRHIVQQAEPDAIGSRDRLAKLWLPQTVGARVILALTTAGTGDCWDADITNATVSECHEGFPRRRCECGRLPQHRQDVVTGVHRQTDSDRDVCQHSVAQNSGRMLDHQHEVNSERSTTAGDIPEDSVSIRELPQELVHLVDDNRQPSDSASGIDGRDCEPTQFFLSTTHLGGDGV
jgi:hypothetical protein